MIKCAGADKSKAKLIGIRELHSKPWRVQAGFRWRGLGTGCGINLLMLLILLSPDLNSTNQPVATVETSNRQARRAPDPLQWPLFADSPTEWIERQGSHGRNFR
jgi:hypothetical protein